MQIEVRPKKCYQKLYHYIWEELAYLFEFFTLLTLTKHLGKVIGNTSTLLSEKVIGVFPSLLSL